VIKTDCERIKNLTKMPWLQKRLAEKLKEEKGQNFSKKFTG
jgi:hypothetical protein